MKVTLDEIQDEQTRRIHLGKLLGTLWSESGPPADIALQGLYDFGPNTSTKAGSRIMIRPLKLAHPDRIAINAPEVPPILKKLFDEPITSRHRPNVRAIRVSKPETFLIPSVQGTLTNRGRSPNWQELGDIAIELPFVKPRYTNAATIKAFAGRPNEVLLHKVGDRWQVVDDNHVIDLQDSAQVYRLGKVEIYS